MEFGDPCVSSALAKGDSDTPPLCFAPNLRGGRPQLPAAAGRPVALSSTALAAGPRAIGPVPGTLQIASPRLQQTPDIRASFCVWSGGSHWLAPTLQVAQIAAQQDSVSCAVVTNVHRDPLSAHAWSGNFYSYETDVYEIGGDAPTIVTDSQVIALASSADTPYLSAVQADGTVGVYPTPQTQPKDVRRLDHKKCIASPKRRSGRSHGIAVDRDQVVVTAVCHVGEHQVVTATAARHLFVWDVRKCASPVQCTWAPRPVTAIVSHGNAIGMVTSDGNATIAAMQQLDCATMGEDDVEWTVPGPRIGSVPPGMRCCFTGGGSGLVAGGVGGITQLNTRGFLQRGVDSARFQSVTWADEQTRRVPFVTETSNGFVVAMGEDVSHVFCIAPY
jgi:hypothetical protein